MINATRRSGTAMAILLGLVLHGCGRIDDVPSGPVESKRVLAEVARTSYGVPHIKASDFHGLGYGLAYAYAQDNLCMFADTLLTVRGERSRYFGPAARATEAVNGEYGAAIDYINLNNEDSDFFFRGYLDPDQLKANYAAGGAEPRALLAGYVAGYNRYLADQAGKYPAACNNAAWVKPLTVEDMYLIATLGAFVEYAHR